MFFCWAQADNTHGVIIRTLSEYNHIKASIDLSNGDKASFAIVKPIIFALKRRVPIKTGRRLQRNAVFGSICFIFRRVELYLHSIYVHPLKSDYKAK